MTITEYLRLNPTARGRIARATVVALRERGFRLSDFKDRSWSVTDEGIGISFDGFEPFIRLPLDELARAVD
jgi:hypothetical protein